MKLEAYAKRSAIRLDGAQPPQPMNSRASRYLPDGRYRIRISELAPLFDVDLRNDGEVVSDLLAVPVERMAA